MQRLLNLIGISVLATSSATAAVSTVLYNTQNINNWIQTNESEKDFSTKINEKITFNENRQFSHSEFKPTGYFLKAGIDYLVQLNKNEISTELVVGQWGNYQILNQNDDTFNRYQITKEISWITPTNSGMLYIADNNQSDIEIINITSDTPNAVVKVPTFTINQTNQAEFINQIRTTNSPFIEFKSNHYFATMQTTVILNEVLPNLQRSFNETLMHWDNVWSWTNEIYGLNESGINQKSSQYIHIANDDSGSGLANAGHGRIMFHKNTGTGKNLFIEKLSNQNVLWHETGHTYQTPQYLWNGLTEVTVEISNYYIHSKMNAELNLFWPVMKERLQQYFSQPNRDFNSVSTSNGVKLTMFWQLHMAFGKNFYSLLNQKYREINQDPNSVTKFMYDEQKIQGFIKITSDITGYNLSPFFKHWGLKPTLETEQETSKYKILTAPIWNNILDSNTKDNPIVQEELVYSELSNVSQITAKNSIVNFGEDLNNIANIQKHFNIPSSININDAKITTEFESFKYQGQYYSLLSLKLFEPNKRPNIKVFPIKANLNNTIMFQYETNRGYVRYVGMFGLDTQNNQIKFYGDKTNEPLSNMPPNEILYNIQIKTNYGVVIKDIDINKLEGFNDVIKRYQLENGIPYLDNYQITITDYLHIKNYFKYVSVNIFDQNNYQKIDEDTTTFVIQNNSLIKIR